MQRGSCVDLVAALKDAEHDAADDDVRDHNQQQNQRHNPRHADIDDIMVRDNITSSPLIYVACNFTGWSCYHKLPSIEVGQTTLA